MTFLIWALEIVMVDVPAIILDAVGGKSFRRGVGEYQ